MHFDGPALSRLVKKYFMIVFYSTLHDAIVILQRFLPPFGLSELLLGLAFKICDGVLSLKPFILCLQPGLLVITVKGVGDKGVSDLRVRIGLQFLRHIILLLEACAILIF